MRFPETKALKSNIKAAYTASWYNAPPLTIPAGYDPMTGYPVYMDIANAPHMLIAGSTGSGKTVFLHSVICSILMRIPAWQIHLYLIDPKQIEFSRYRDAPQVRDVITEPAAAVHTLKRLETEMRRRYRTMNRKRVDNVAALNMPSIVVVIDELADLIYTSKRETESYISALARLGRAAGIHVIAATQRPTRDVITGQIKLNMPARVALRVPASSDSVVLLGHKGAETLKGRGDMILMSGDGSETHLQGYYISYTDIAYIVKTLKKGASIFERI